MAVNSLSKWEIYTLSDPRDGVVWYVGASRGGRDRFSRHLWEAKHGNYGRVYKWIRSLFEIGVQPRYSVVERGNGATWADAERKWIAFYRVTNERLANISAGGNGNPVGFKMPPRSPEHTAKLRAAHIGRKHSAQERANRSAALKGRVVSAETRAKIGAARRGKKQPLSADRLSKLARQKEEAAARKAAERAARAARPKRTLSPEHRAKLSEARRGWKATEECRAKISAANKGRRHTEEARAKISVARTGKGHPISDEQRAKQSAAMKGKVFTAEHRANISASAKKRGMPPITPERLAKQSAALKGKPWSVARRAAYERRMAK